jgi:Hyccin
MILQPINRQIKTGQPSDGPMGISVALTPATTVVTVSKSMITNASFRTKKLPGESKKIFFTQPIPLLTFFVCFNNVVKQACVKRKPSHITSLKNLGKNWDRTSFWKYFLAIC